MSGIRISDEVMDHYNQLRFGREMRFFTCKLSNDLTEVVVDKTGGSDSQWNDLVSFMPGRDCRYGFFNFDFEKEGGKRTKVVFVRWCPETSAIKQKIMYTTTTQGLKRKLEGIGCDLQATDASELCMEEVLSRVSRVS